MLEKTITVTLPEATFHLHELNHLAGERALTEQEMSEQTAMVIDDNLFQIYPRCGRHPQSFA
jgi:hypothetical protein